MQHCNEQPKIPGDSLNLSQQPNILSQLGQKQQIKYSGLIMKINEEKMVQERIFLLTNEAIYNIAKRSSLIKSLMSKLISWQCKYSIKRRIPLKQIYGITLSKSKQNGEFVLHVSDDYDYRYCSDSHEKKVLLMKKICQIYTLQTGKKLAFYFKDEIVLIDYTTRKCDFKNKIDRKPHDDPVLLTSDDFEQYQLPDLNYKLQYAKNSTNITMKSFKPIFQISKLESNVQYFTVTTTTMYLKLIMEMLKLKSKYLLQPEFVFSTKTKIQLITPFMIGGNLFRKLQTCVRISNELAYFYIAQLILILEQFEKINVFCSNFCLENFFINENGYLRMLGMDPSLKTGYANTTMYDIIGYLPYIAPEMIYVKGYDHRVNLWKLGICAHYLLTGTFPFEGSNTKKVYHQILNKQLKSDIPDFLRKLLDRNPSQRPSLQQLKVHPKLIHLDWQKIKSETMIAPYQPDPSSWRGNLPSLLYLRPMN